MTNREQLAWAINYSEYEDREVAEQICDMIDAIGGHGYGLRKYVERWLELECDPDTNNCGELDKKERADYWLWGDEE